jgi:diguanylate cyclase
VQPKSADPDQWKKKYFDALRSLEQEERGFRSLESLLRRIVNRLCLAAMGQSPALDAELRRLTDAMRKKAEEVELERLFTPLTEAIGALDAPAQPPVARPAADATTVTVALVPAVAAATVVTASSRPARAPVDLEATAGDSPSRTASNVTPLPVRPPDVAVEDAVLPGDERVRLLLSRILTELKRDAKLAARVAMVDGQLAHPLKGSQLPPLLSAIADLAIERVSGIEQEKIEVEKLLAQISTRLDEMGSYMAGEDEDRKLSLENTQELNARLTLEMTELGSSVDTALDIVQLKVKVRSRLDSIGAHLQEYRAREDDRVRQQWERSEKMRQRLERLEQESREMQVRLRDEQRLSMLDALTQMPNRMAYDQRMAEEFARWQRFSQPLCVAAWDIDHFKRVNDAYGHRAGDKVLRIVADCMRERLRETDFLARYGGEEFVMILPGTDAEGALRVADEMRAAVAALGFHFRGNPVNISVSCGVTPFKEGDTADEAFERADKALYRAKQNGRNRCESG